LLLDTIIVLAYLLTYLFRYLLNTFQFSSKICVCPQGAGLPGLNDSGDVPNSNKKDWLNNDQQ